MHIKNTIEYRRTRHNVFYNISFIVTEVSKESVMKIPKQ